MFAPAHSAPPLGCPKLPKLSMSKTELTISSPKESGLRSVVPHLRERRRRPLPPAARKPRPRASASPPTAQGRRALHRLPPGQPPSSVISPPKRLARRHTPRALLPNTPDLARHPALTTATPLTTGLSISALICRPRTHMHARTHTHTRMHARTPASAHTRTRTSSSNTLRRLSLLFG